MALHGKALLINWSNVAERDRAQYYAWHDNEHMEGRLRLPGFKRGRRFWRTDADRDVLNIYEVDDIKVLTGADYSRKASNPSEAYKSAGKIITDAIRALAHVRFSRGKASGSHLLSVRFTLEREEWNPLLETGLLTAIAAVPGVVAVHLCVADQGTSSVITADREGRPTAVPAWALLIEATTIESLDICRRTYLGESRLKAAGCQAPISIGAYILQMSMTKQDLDPSAVDL